MLNQIARVPSTSVAAGVTTTQGVDGNAVNWSIKLNKGTATVGTLTLTAKGPGASTAETVYDSTSTAIMFNCASSTPQTYYFTGKPIDSFTITPSGLDGTYTYAFGQW